MLTVSECVLTHFEAVQICNTDVKLPGYCWRRDVSEAISDPKGTAWQIAQNL